MENLYKQFPAMSLRILQQLDNQSLVNSMEANKAMRRFVQVEKFFWLRIIKAHKGNFIEYQEAWKKCLEKVPTAFVKEIATAVEKFFQKKETRFSMQWHPLFIGK